MADDLAGIVVEDLLVSVASTLASVAYAKLDAKDLPEAKRAIDALASLVPHLDSDLANELQNALTGLQMAFVTASSG